MNQSQIMGALVAYSTEEAVAWPTPWAMGPGFVAPKIADAHAARVFTCRAFELLAATQTLPSSLFICPAAKSRPRFGRKAAVDGRNGGTWGLGPDGFVMYAFDWASPADPDTDRPIIAERQIGQHPGGSVTVVFGDAHTKRLRTTLRPTVPGLITEDCDGRSVPVTTEDKTFTDDIYSADGDGGDPLTPAKGHPLRAWVK